MEVLQMRATGAHNLVSSTPNPNIAAAMVVPDDSNIEGSLSKALNKDCVLEDSNTQINVGAGSPLSVFPSAAAEEAAVLAALRAEKEERVFLSSGDEGVDVLGHISKAPSLNVRISKLSAVSFLFCTRSYLLVIF